MNKLSTVLAALLLCMNIYARAQSNENKNLLLWYDTPAADWNAALPLGNGHLGAMLMGDPTNELLQINDNTLYSGEPSNRYTKVDMQEGYPSIVKHLQAGEYKEATDTLQKYVAGRLHENYQPLCDWHLTDHAKGDISHYRRTLDIARSVATVSYQRNGYSYRREVFASHPADVIVMKLTTDHPEGWDISLWMTSIHPTATVEANAQRGVVQLRGQAPGYAQRRTYEQIETWGHQLRHPEIYNSDKSRKGSSQILYGKEIGGKGTFFEAALQVQGKGIQTKRNNEKLHLQGAQEIVLVFAAATSYNGFDKSPSREGRNPSKIVRETLLRTAKATYDTLWAEHQTDYQRLFNRFSIELQRNTEAENEPTDQRIIRFHERNDLGLVSLLTQYGRYLMISGSREGGQPLNLQGLWNKDIIPPWDGGYTTNINVEMNYWPAEVANLSECHQPLIQMIKECSVTGSECARQMYHLRGWVGHHNCSIWRETYPNDGDPTVYSWNMMAAWLCTHLWEHFSFSRDTTFALKEAYPLMKSAAQFCMDWLVEDEEGHLITPISVSPECKFINPQNGEYAGLSMGCTMDMTLIRELFARTRQLAQLGNVDSAFSDSLANYEKCLLPFKIGAYGRLQEWNKDFEDYDKHHRHVSHLVGLFPLNQITPATPELFEAARQSLEIRGDEATGWSIGWKINLWARLLDGQRAYKIVKNMIRPVDFGPEATRSNEGGLYPNLFDAHPPFQIDGNFGFTAGICEMVLQSQNGELHLLPAIPTEWGSGELKGVVARGGYIVDISWAKGHITNLKIISPEGVGGTMIKSKYPLPNGKFAGNTEEDIFK